MPNGGFEKRLNVGIYDNVNGHRSFDMYQMINDFGSMLEYDVLNMFWGFFWGVTMVLYIGNFLIRPLVTHFLSGNAVLP